MRLVVAQGQFKGRAFPIEEGNNLIGRWDPDQAAFPEIDLEEVDEEAKISRKHAVVVRRGEAASIEDVGSRNGTFINRGARIEPGQKHELHNGDEIVLGKVVLMFEA